MSKRATCHLCGQTVRVDLLAQHLYVEHDIDIADQLERWPDGDPVVIDLSLEPEDFTP